MEKYINEMLRAPLFQGIAKSDIVPMMTCLAGYVKQYKKGEYIIIEQDIVKNIGVIFAGSIDMIKEDVWGNKTTLVRLNEKELFGETFACGENPESSVSFLAYSDCEILFIPFTRVMNMCSNSCMFHHRLIENMVSIIAAKNRQLMNKVDILSKKNIREKILAYLSYQSQEQGTKYFKIPFGRLELADFLCVDRSSLTRELNNMKKDSIIDFDKNVFSLLLPISDVGK